MIQLNQPYLMSNEAQLDVVRKEAQDHVVMDRLYPKRSCCVWAISLSSYFKIFQLKENAHSIKEGKTY